MCGIVAYIGGRDSVPILLEGLARLEYRGYDSAGLAVLSRGGDMRVRKAKGRVGELSATVPSRFKGSPGIGHTRWATHGVPSDANAHPHVCGPIAIVHNGIIENASELRAKLAASGAEFSSETDSELFAHLIAARPEGDLEEAVRAALKQVVGTYGLAVLDSPQPGPDGRRPQRQPGAARARRQGDVRGVRRRRDRPLHPPGGAPRRRRDSHRHGRRLPDLDPGRPPDDEAACRHRHRRCQLRRRRSRALHAQGDPRAAQGDRAGAERPAGRPVRHGTPRRAEHRPARSQGHPAGQDPGLRFGVLLRPRSARS